LEKELFGRNPNYDWLRALHVQDSQPVEARECLALRTVRVYPTATQDSPGLNVDVEAVKQGTVFHTAITIDEYGFRGEAVKKLGWQDKRGWIIQLPKLARAHAQQRLLMEAEHFRPADKPARVQRAIARLINIWSELAQNEMLLQIGWGAGWESKTLGSKLLRGDDRAFERLLSQYRMTRKQDRRREGDPFPKSRHLALTRQGQPSAPMGWVKVRLETGQQ
jgi:CRISPR-associated protein Csm5